MDLLPLLTICISVGLILVVGSFYLGRRERLHDTLPDNLPPEIYAPADHLHSFGRMGRDGKWRCYYCKQVKDFP